jgi:hypothetical protein
VIKLLALGVWVSVVVFLSSYVVADMQASAIAPIAEASEEPYLEGLEYRKIAPLTIPMISNGDVGGYIVAKLVYTADARTLHELPLEPEAFVADEAFRAFYSDGRIEFGSVAKQNLEEIVVTIQRNVNERLGIELVQDVLIEGVDYVDRKTLGRTTGDRPDTPPDAAQH